MFAKRLLNGLIFSAFFLICLPILFCHHKGRGLYSHEKTASHSTAPLLKHSPRHWKQQEFLISYCCSAPPVEENMARAEAEHFNLVPAWQETLRFAQKHHVKVMLEHGLLTPTTIHSAEKLKQLDSVIDQVKNDPALGAYYVFDEPTENAFPDVAAFVEYIRKRDPAHLSFVNLLPISGLAGRKGTDPSKTYLEYLEKYVEMVRPDLLSYDFYTFYRNEFGGPVDLPGYFDNLALVRHESLQAHIPFMNIIQACPAYIGHSRTPNASEMRWQVYTTLAYGARGISYFLYWSPKPYTGLYLDGKPSELLKPVVQLNREMAALGPELMAIDSVSVYHTAPVPSGGTQLPPESQVKLKGPSEFVIGYFSQKGEANTFMIVNRDYKKGATAILQVEGKLAMKEFDRANCLWTEIKANAKGEFNVALPAGDGRLFRF